MAGEESAAGPWQGTAAAGEGTGGCSSAFAGPRAAVAMLGEIRLTRVRKQGGALLGKRIFAGEHGGPVSDGSPCAMASGMATRLRLNGSPAADLARAIIDLGSHEALILGDLADGLPDNTKLQKDDLADPSR